MRNDLTVKKARRAVAIAKGNLDRAAKAMLKSEGMAGSPLEYLSERLDEAQTTLERLLAERKACR